MRYEKRGEDQGWEGLQCCLLFMSAEHAANLMQVPTYDEAVSDSARTWGRDALEASFEQQPRSRAEQEAAHRARFDDDIKEDDRSDDGHDDGDDDDDNDKDHDDDGDDRSSHATDPLVERIPLILSDVPVVRDTTMSRGSPAQQPGSPVQSAAQTTQPSGRIHAGENNDGVWRNLSAKPDTRAEKRAEEETPPPYEQAAADISPPYWETTMFAPGLASDEVYIDGMPVGTVFAFLWNMFVSVSFQVVGFLLTFLLSTTHAAKQGSRAGFGVTLIQYGFYLRQQDNGFHVPTEQSIDGDEDSLRKRDAGDGNGILGSIPRSEWVSMILIIVGWFLLVRSVVQYVRARRMEQCVRQTSTIPGAGMAVVADTEAPESAV